MALAEYIPKDYDYKLRKVNPHFHVYTLDESITVGIKKDGRKHSYDNLIRIDHEVEYGRISKNYSGFVGVHALNSVVYLMFVLLNSLSNKAGIIEC